MVKCDSKCNQLKGTIYDNQQVKRLTKTASSYVPILILLITTSFKFLLVIFPKSLIDPK